MPSQWDYPAKQRKWGEEETTTIGRLMLSDWDDWVKPTSRAAKVNDDHREEAFFPPTRTTRSSGTLAHPALHLPLILFVALLPY